MAVIFDTYERVVPTWLAAARYLEGNGYSARNLVLEIPNPGTLKPDDRRIRNAVNAELVTYEGELSIETVASTIFPQDLYARHGRAGLYADYQRVMARAKKEGTWGTYFDRMTRRTNARGEMVNPLNSLIEKLKRSAAPGARIWQSTYELSPSDPAEDIDPGKNGGELATYDPGADRNRPLGGPCLSHVSFKITGGQQLDLSAMYRSHYYCARTLGNLIGLARLQKFVAIESGLQLGVLTCLSTHAELDWNAWGGARKGKALLATF